MPNGGSDCCGTCWFNGRNQREAGYGHARGSEPPFCTIRGYAIVNPFYTYCANHPHRRPERDVIPIGPVLTGEERKLSEPSPDTEEIRRHLLALLGTIEEQPPAEYPIGAALHEVVVWQLGEFRETRAIGGLRRIASFDPDASDDTPFRRTNQRLVHIARAALSKIGSGP